MARVDTGINHWSILVNQIDNLSGSSTRLKILTAKQGRLLSRWLVCASFLLFGFAFETYRCFGQNPTLGPDDYFANGFTEDERDLTQWSELLSEYRDNPLELNQAGLAELESFPLFSESLARVLFEYRKTAGPYKSIDDLLRIPGFSPMLLALIQPYVGVKPAGRSVSSGRMEVISRVTRSFDSDGGSSRYQGSALRNYNRIRYNLSDRFVFGLTTEKDPGENMSWDPGHKTYGYDFLSFYGAWKGTGIVRQIIAGDYAVGSGYGLVFSRAISMGKTNAWNGFEPGSIGLAPYRSSDENRFYRGAAVQLKPTAHLNLAVLISHRQLDATILSDSTSQGGSTIVTSCPSTGYHRTPGEIDRKGRLEESLAGAVATFSYRKFQVGLASYLSMFSPGLAASLAGPDVHSDFARIQTAGLFLMYAPGSYNLFAEVGRDFRQTWAGQAGILWAPDRVMDIHFRGRWIPGSFYSPHGSIFGERSGPPVDEKGLFVGLRMKPAENIEIEVFRDVFVFQKAAGTVPLPRHGIESFARVACSPTSWLTFTLSGRIKKRDTETTNVLSVRTLTDHRRRTIRLDGNYLHSKTVQLQTRFEIVRVQTAETSESKGFYVSQGIRWQVSGILSLDTRYGIFDSEDYDSRIFQSEGDLTYTYAMHAFSGRGTRAYVLVTLNPVNRVYVQFKYAVTRSVQDPETGPLPTYSYLVPEREIRLQMRVVL